MIVRHQQFDLNFSDEATNDCELVKLTEDELIVQFTPAAASKAKKYLPSLKGRLGHFLTYADVFNTALWGIVRAKRTYKAPKDISNSTFVFRSWIHNNIEWAINNMIRSVKTKYSTGSREDGDNRKIYDAPFANFSEDQEESILNIHKNTASSPESLEIENKDYLNKIVSFFSKFMTEKEADLFSRLMSGEELKDIARKEKVSSQCLYKRKKQLRRIIGAHIEQFDAKQLHYLKHWRSL